MENITSDTIAQWLDAWGQTDRELADSINNGRIDSELFVNLGYEWLFLHDRWILKGNSLYSEEDERIEGLLRQENDHYINTIF